MRRPVLMAAAVLLTAALAACGGSQHNTSYQPTTGPLAKPDPAPGKVAAARVIGPKGGTFGSGTLHVTVPTGAVASGTTIRVETASAVGAWSGEIFGQPVTVTHIMPLAKPLTLTWHVKGVSAAQLRSAVLAKWDPNARVWRASSVPVTIRGLTLTAHVKSFSTWDWILNSIPGAEEKAFQWIGTRTSPPKCSGAALPSWVDQTVSTDGGTTDAATLTCFEPDKDGGVTVLVTDNRVFAQELVMTSGDQQWKSASPVDQGDSVTDAVFTAARAVFDTPTTFLLQPLNEEAVGIARPATPGPRVIQAVAKVNYQTVLADLAAFALNQVDIGGTDNPLTDAFIQALFACGGSQLLDKPNANAATMVGGAVSALAHCAKEINNPESEFGAKFQEIALDAIESHPESADTIAKAYRLIDEAGEFVAALKFADVAFYVADQLANAEVGPLELTIDGRGTPQALGAWTPSCNSLKTDSNALYKNLALQDAFADTRKELWQFTAWVPDAAVAVRPLAQCSPQYRSQLATYLPSSWGDQKAAGIVADDIRQLGAPAAPPTSAPASQPSAATESFTPGSQFDDECVIAWPTAPTYTSNAIEMTMSCEHVPESKFLFTDVVYGDPQLQPTPDTGYMHVVGTVLGTAHSGYGFNELEVQASSVTF